MIGILLLQQDKLSPLVTRRKHAQHCRLFLIWHADSHAHYSATGMGVDCLELVLERAKVRKHEKKINY